MVSHDICGTDFHPRKSFLLSADIRTKPDRNIRIIRELPAGGVLQVWYQPVDPLWECTLQVRSSSPELIPFIIFQLLYSVNRHSIWSRANWSKQIPTFISTTSFLASILSWSLCLDHGYQRVVLRDIHNICEAIRRCIPCRIFCYPHSASWMSTCLLGFLCYTDISDCPSSASSDPVTQKANTWDQRTIGRFLVQTLPRSRESEYFPTLFVTCGCRCSGWLRNLGIG